MTIQAFGFLYSVGATGPGERECVEYDHERDTPDHTHWCWIRSPHLGGHVCVCYWVWPQKEDMNEDHDSRGLVDAALERHSLETGTKKR